MLFAFVLLATAPSLPPPGAPDGTFIAPATPPAAPSESPVSCGDHGDSDLGLPALTWIGCGCYVLDLDVPPSTSSCEALMPVLAFMFGPRSLADTCDVSVASLEELIGRADVTWSPPDPAWTTLRDACPATCALGGTPTPGCAPPAPPPTSQPGLAVRRIPGWPREGAGPAEQSMALDDISMHRERRPPCLHAVCRARCASTRAWACSIHCSSAGTRGGRRTCASDRTPPAARMASS
jgi:hypothetical protein